MIKNYNNITEIKQDLTVIKERKELYGEVFTPFNLIDKIISLIQIEHFKNKNKKWLDIGAGSGYFSIYLYFKLFENLKNQFKNDNQCKEHIINNMIYMVEIQENNYEMLRELFGKKANIINDDFINYNFDNYNVKEFDYIIGNPPFNCNGMKKVPTNNNVKKKNDGKTIWIDFLKKSISILKKEGLLNIIIPSIWLKPDKEKIYDYLLQYKINYLHCLNNTETNKIFKGNAQTPSCYFLLEKIETDNFISIWDNDTNKYINYCYNTLYKNSLPIPLKCQSIINKLQPFLKYGTLPIFKTNLPSSKTLFSLHKENKYSHKNISTCLIKNSIPEFVVNYSNIKCPFSDKKKLILANKMYGIPYIDYNGEYGISNRDNYIILEDDKSINNLEIIKTFLSTQTVLYLFDSTRYRMAYLEKYIFELIPDITLLPNFPENINDDTIALYFNFDEREKSIINNYKKNIKFFD